MDKPKRIIAQLDIYNGFNIKYFISRSDKWMNYFRNRLVNDDVMAHKLRNRKIYKLNDILPHMKGTTALSNSKSYFASFILWTIHNWIGSDIPGDWVVLGVLAMKLNLDTASKTMIVKLFDMNDCILNLFICKTAFDVLKNQKMGSFVAILNPVIMMPNQVT